MFSILKIFVLVALIKILITTDKPFLCAGLYAGLVFLFGLMAGTKGPSLIRDVLLDRWHAPGHASNCQSD